VLAWFQGERAAQAVSDLLMLAREQEVPLLIPVINAAEVWYIIAREVSPAEADAAVAALRNLGMEFVDAGWDLARAAGTIKARHALSFADCFAAALATSRQAELVTGDREFKPLSDELRIRWLES
jgi:ribonuclease VapC